MKRGNVKLRSLALSLCLSAVAQASSLSTCSIFRFSIASHVHEVASTREAPDGSCDEQLTQQITLPGGDTFSMFRRASAFTGVGDEADERGFFSSFGDEAGYLIQASATVGGNSFVRVGDVFPGEESSFDFAFGASAVIFDFYERTFNITNPRAVTGGFGAAPDENECFSGTFGLGTCEVSWPGAETFNLTGAPFTINGFASVFASGEEGAQQAQLRLTFENPLSYTFIVRDAQGNVIPESQWGVVPEPLSMLLVGCGMIALLLVKRAGSTSAWARKLLRLTR